MAFTALSAAAATCGSAALSLEIAGLISFIILSLSLSEELAAKYPDSPKTPRLDKIVDLSVAARRSSVAPDINEPTASKKLTIETSGLCLDLVLLLVFS